MNRSGQVWHVKAGAYPGVFLVIRSGVRESGILEHECLILALDRPESNLLRAGLLHTFYEDAQKHPWDSYAVHEEIEQLT